MGERAQDPGTDGGPTEGWDGEAVVERAVLSESAEGRAIAAAFIEVFGAFVDGTVRPALRDVAASGGEPQLLVNGLAELLRDVADSMEWPAGQRPGSLGAPGSAGPVSGSER